MTRADSYSQGRLPIPRARSIDFLSSQSDDTLYQKVQAKYDKHHNQDGLSILLQPFKKPVHEGLGALAQNNIDQYKQEEQKQGNQDKEQIVGETG